MEKKDLWSWSQNHEISYNSDSFFSSIEFETIIKKELEL